MDDVLTKLDKRYPVVVSCSDLILKSKAEIQALAAGFKIIIGADDGQEFVRKYSHHAIAIGGDEAKCYVFHSGLESDGLKGPLIVPLFRDLDTFSHISIGQQEISTGIDTIKQELVGNTILLAGNLPHLDWFAICAMLERPQHSMSVISVPPGQTIRCESVIGSCFRLNEFKRVLPATVKSIVLSHGGDFSDVAHSGRFCQILAFPYPFAKKVENLGLNQWQLCAGVEGRVIVDRKIQAPFTYGDLFLAHVGDERVIYSGHYARLRAHGIFDVDPDRAAFMSLRENIFGRKQIGRLLQLNGIEPSQIRVAQKGTAEERFVTAGKVENKRGEFAQVDFYVSDAWDYPSFPDEFQIERWEKEAQSKFSQDIRLKFILKDEREKLQVLGESKSRRMPKCSEYNPAILGQFANVDAFDLWRSLGEAAKSRKKIKFFRKAEESYLPSEISYAELMQSAESIAGSLTKIDASPEFLIHVSREPLTLMKSVWAGIALGSTNIPFCLKDDRDLARLQSIITQFPFAQTFLLVDSANQAMVADLAIREGLLNEIFQVEELERTPSSLFNRRQQDTVLILFTSGSSGVPKGVQLTHANIASMVKGMCSTLGAKPERTFNWFPLDHIGGLVQFHLRDTLLAAEQFHSESSYVLADPLGWLRILSEHRIDTTWAPNFAFSLILEHAKRARSIAIDLSCVRFMLNGGEKICHRICLEFVDFLSQFGLAHTVIKPCFGMTETSSAIVVSNNFLSDSKVDVLYLEASDVGQMIQRSLPGAAIEVACVGKPIPGAQVRVVDDNAEIVSKEVVGHIEIRGPQVTKGLWQRKNFDDFTVDGWLRMGDLGFVSGDNLYVTGRAKDIAIINGKNVALFEVEQVAAQHLFTTQDKLTICSFRTQKDQTDRLFMLIDSQLEGIDLKELNLRIQEKTGVVVSKMAYANFAELPRTAIGKLRKEEIRNQFMRGDFKAAKGFGDRIQFGIDSWFYTFEFVKSTNLYEVPGERPPLVPIDQLTDEFLTVHSLVEKGLVVDVRQTTLDVQGILKRLMMLNEREGSFRCVILCSQAIYIDSNDERPDDGLILGAVQTLNRRTSCERYKLLDVDFDAQVDRILSKEIQFWGYDKVVAYRKNQRLVPQLRHVHTLDARSFSGWNDGTFVIIGGLGGIGVHLALWLAKKYRGRILLLGRSSLNGNREKRMLLDCLLSLAEEEGAHIEYRACDAGNQADLREVIFGFVKDRSLSAVFNLAGEGQIGLDISTAVESEDFARYNNRVATANTLIDLDLKCQVIHFSSINGVLGGEGFLAYSAACTQIAQNLAYANSKFGQHHRVIHWSMWENVGMASGTSNEMIELGRNRGYETLTVQQGLDSLNVVLQNNLNDVLVGIDGGVNVGLKTKRKPRNVVCCLESRANFSPKQILQIATIVSPVPLSIEKQKAGEESYDPVAGEVLLSQWKALLKNPQIGPDSDFFQSGGDSILAIQAVAQAKSQGIAMKMKDLLTNRTIRKLSSRIIGLSTFETSIVRDENELPLLPSQAWYFEKQNGGNDVFNMSFVFNVSEEIGPAAMKEILQHVLGRHSAFRLRFQEDHAFFVNDTPKPNLRVIDETLSPEEVRNLLDDCEKRLCLSDGVLHCATMFREYGKPGRVLSLVIHHLIVDGVSWRTIFSDLDEAAKRLLKGKLETPIESQPLKTFSLALRNKTFSKGGIEFWREYLADVESREIFASSEREAECKYLKIPAYLYARIEAFAMNGIATRDILLTSLIDAYQAFSTRSRFAIDLEGHGRVALDGTKDIGGGMGWFTAICPMIVGQLDESNTYSFVTNSLLKIAQHDVFYGVGCYIDRSIKPVSSELSFNHLGNFSTTEMGEYFSPRMESFKAVFSPNYRRTNEIDFMGIKYSDSLVVGVKFATTQYRGEDMGRLLDLFVQKLEACCEMIGGREF